MIPGCTFAAPPEDRRLPHLMRRAVLPTAHGQPLTRPALTEHLRSAGHPVSNARASVLVKVLRSDSGYPVNGHGTAAAAVPARPSTRVVLGILCPTRGRRSLSRFSSGLARPTAVPRPRLQAATPFPPSAESPRQAEVGLRPNFQPDLGLFAAVREPTHAVGHQDCRTVPPLRDLYTAPAFMVDLTSFGSLCSAGSPRRVAESNAEGEGRLVGVQREDHDGIVGHLHSLRKENPCLTTTVWPSSGPAPWG